MSLVFDYLARISKSLNDPPAEIDVHKVHRGANLAHIWASGSSPIRDDRRGTVMLDPTCIHNPHESLSALWRLIVVWLKSN
ncbi:hypothetical protein PAAG_11536 [Paracoccidioides lutzii Pb01]|uniref:Uncharacterized protein n=1 Tax=Paracoccidioides lutzii (strain ATCC MYA-826 / Pb01) TaxID=502779 RepID=A0A0A2V6I9_PARBA|nr:hypothetical protein PAAG_11536 [Paracoccidioides lutzii Pb01]KGQ01690.1 hypothetical protein PAAG_11536 [Paracoccidioides lutzii Pb01]